LATAYALSIGALIVAWFSTVGMAQSPLRCG
jgi:hypothetical protein